MMIFGFAKNKSPSLSNDKKSSTTLFGRLSDGLKRTRHQLSAHLSKLILGKKTIDPALLEELETTLLLADVGSGASQAILAKLTQRVARNQLTDPAMLIQALQDELLALLTPCEQSLTVDTAPFVILVVGVNGVGKTTSIAKLAHYFQQQDKTVMLAAGDTFRAAAVEQLQIWGERNNATVIAQRSGTDSAAVIFDAVQSATAKGVNVLIADTAGRLHTQDNLMAELKKIKRVIAKANPTAPHETMLVIDAGTGQNALQQAQQFHRAIGLTGITLTKLDGTAKGGIIFAIAQQMQLPVRFIGIGERIDDLKPFDAHDFVTALFAQET